MYTGTFVSIPLTLLQAYSTHLPITVEQTLLNVAISHAIYDGDRLSDQPQAQTNIPYITTKAATVGSMYYLVQNEQLFYAFLVFLLNSYYKDFKTNIGPIKPFFVAFIWTLAIYFMPLALNDVDTIANPAQPLFIFSQIVGLSNKADIKDVAEDEANNIITPSVTLKEESQLYSLCWIFASIYTHTMCNPYRSYEILYDLCLLCASIM